MTEHNFSTASSTDSLPPSIRKGKIHHRKRSPEVRRTFLGRKYTSSKIESAPSRTDDTSEDEEDEDFSTIAVDEMGLPLTYSDQYWAVGTEIDNALDHQKRLDQQEQLAALDDLLAASRAVSRLKAQQAKNQSSCHTSETPEASHCTSLDCFGPSTLEELNTLRSAIDNLWNAYQLADPSGRGRKLRHDRFEQEARTRYAIPSLKRKSLPDCDVPFKVIVPEEINPYLSSPEPQEELLSVTSPLMMRTPKMRGEHPTPARRKLQADGDALEDYWEEVEEHTTANYYITKHRASRQYEITGFNGMLKTSCRKAARRRASILSSEDGLIKTKGLGRFAGINSNFLETLDDEYRRLDALPIPDYPQSYTAWSSSSSGEDATSASDYSRSSIDANSSDGSHSPVSEATSFHSDMVHQDSDNPNDPSWLRSFSDISTNATSSKSSNETQGDVRIASSQSPTALSPPRPKRHPLRSEKPAMTRSPNDDGQELCYSPSFIGSDLTPRPNNVAFQL